MNEEEYRAAMAREARLANLIALRRLMSDNNDVHMYFRGSNTPINARIASLL